MKIKVLHIITRLDAGGSATNTIETVTRLDKNKYETTLLSGSTFDPGGKINQSLQDRNINCIFLEDLCREISPLKDLKTFLKIFSIIKQGEYEIVHTHSSKAGILGRWAAWFAGTKIIVHTPHGHVFYGYFGPLKTRFFMALEELAAQITHKIITLTDIGIEDHVRFKIAKRRRFKTIYSGIAIEEFRSDPKKIEEKRRELDLDSRDFVFGSVARLDPIKGNEYIINAMSEVIKEFPNAKLLLVGDGIQRQMLEEKCANLKIQHCVIFTGFQADVATYLGVMDAFILASINEGMGRAILEAMAAQKPVIGSRTGGIPELIDDNIDGMLFEPKNSSDLARKMKEMIRDEQLRAQFVFNADKKLTQKFSLEKMVQDIDDLYQDLRERKVSRWW